MSFQCLNPRIAYQEQEGEKPRFLKGTDYEGFVKIYSKKSRVLFIPCGKCVNCQKRKSQEWTSRLLKEMDSHKFAYFITLTYEKIYDDETGEIKDINKRDLQLFLKRYRKKFGVDLTYYITGEHGETTGRPHYHAIFFQDKEITDLKFYANNLYISDSFAKCWSHGNCLISKQVNERSIKYTIAYTLKKLGEEKVVLMSKGIGLDYLNGNKERIKEFDGFYIQDGFKQRPPTYFKRKIKESTDINDIMYLHMKDEEPKPSTLLTGSTYLDLISEFLQTEKQCELKGKGAF